MKNNIKETIKSIKRSRSALEWWNNLPIQNLKEPLESWAGYTMKYFPDRGGCYAYSNEEIFFVWEKERINLK
jgi:hypothetical protein